jgi:hypothetical protein
MILDEILQERCNSCRARINPRCVKRKMSDYNLRPRQQQRARRIDFSKWVRLLNEQYCGEAADGLGGQRSSPAFGRRRGAAAELAEFELRRGRGWRVHAGRRWGLDVSPASASGDTSNLPRADVPSVTSGGCFHWPCKITCGYLARSRRRHAGVFVFHELRCPLVDPDVRPAAQNCGRCLTGSLLGVGLAQNEGRYHLWVVKTPSCLESATCDSGLSVRGTTLTSVRN